MPSSRWLRPVDNQKESSDQSEPTPNVSMRDVRRLAREKAARHDSIENTPLTDATTVGATVGTTVNPDEALDSDSPPTVVPTVVGATVGTTVENPVAALPAREQIAKQEETDEPSVNVPPDTSVDALPRASQPQYLDATHTASEQRVYSVMYRETISKGTRERHYGPKELCAKTGIRSDRTVRIAVRGLLQKFSIEIVSHGAYFPQGPRYRIFEPREVLRRRRAAGLEIDAQTKKIVGPAVTPVATPVATPVGATVGATVDGGGKNYRSTPVEITGVTPVEITGVYKEINNINGPEIYSNNSSSNKSCGGDDDDAFAAFVDAVRRTAREITGRESSQAEAARWVEVADVLMTELRIAAGRTTVSNVPAFLAEHLRRRLWKNEQGQIEAEAAEQKGDSTATKVDASNCPDCFGTGMWYPEGFDRGVARCTHKKLSENDGG